MKQTMLAIAMLASAGSAGIAQKPSQPDYKITVSGIVRNRNDDVLTGAEVIVGNLHAVTNEAGEFMLTGVPGGSVFLVVRRIGYVPGTISFESEPTLRAVTVAATLAPAAVTLGTIVIEGKTMDHSLWKSGFYSRQQLGTGYFFDPERLAHSSTSISTLMNEVPAVRVERQKGGMAIPMSQVSAGMSGPIYCAMNVFLDGQFLPWATQVGIDDVIAQSDVKAVEVYPRPGMLPMALRGGTGTQSISSGLTNDGISIGNSNIECGAILLWSKTADEARQKK